jgi:lipopolysaccharide export system permease protein
MHLLDRLLIRGYLKAYFICLASLLSLYIVVDLFTYMDDFTDQHHGLLPVLKHITVYYGYKITQIFDKLCEVIVLLAAMFTIAWMQRSNELMPLLSAGVSTHRVVRPILCSACVMLGLSVLNQEFIIPPIGNFLVYPRDDPRGEKGLEVHGAFEPNDIHIKGELAYRKDQVVHKFSCLIPDTVAPSWIHIIAEEAHYFAPGQGPCGGGGWLLTGAKPAEIDHWNDPTVLETLDSGKYFLHTKEVDFDNLTRSRTWFVNAKTSKILEELNRTDSTRLTAMSVIFHMRLTRPILGLLLVFMGLSVILRDQNRNVFISTALCLVMCALFFGAIFACKHLGDSESISPALAAWLPVLVFGPLSFVLFDAIHT